MVHSPQSPLLFEAARSQPRGLDDDGVNRIDTSLPLCLQPPFIRKRCTVRRTQTARHSIHHATASPHLEPRRGKSNGKWSATEASTHSKGGSASILGIRCVAFLIKYFYEAKGGKERSMFWGMRLRHRHWLIRRDWKQLAPDDAYLSCEYIPHLPGDGREG